MERAVNTTVIVLRKQPFKEEGLILTGLSPDYGKMSLLVHGAQKITPRKTPVVDIFRELEVGFNDRERSSELIPVNSVDLLLDFSPVGNDVRHFKFAGRIASFLLKNTQANLAMALTYDALRNSFLQLMLPPQTEGQWTLEQNAVTVKITYLYENGLLPEVSSAKETDFLEALIAAGVEGSVMPEAPAEYFHKLNLWLDELIAYHHLSK